MKKKYAVLLSIVASIFVNKALAENDFCTFTEPYLSVDIQTEKNLVAVTNNLESTTQEFPIHEIRVDGDSKTVVFGFEEELTGLTYKLDFKGSDNRTELIYPYSAEMQTGDTNPQFGGCESKDFKVTEQILNCNELGDGVEYAMCESSQAKTCQESAKQVVNAVNSIRSGTPVKDLNVKELVPGLRFEVQFKIAGQTAAQKNLVTVAQENQGNSCKATSVEVDFQK